MRGAFVIGAYGLLLAADLGAGLGGLAAIQLVLIAPGLPLAALAAVYTGFLFAQARGRDLWQSPLLPAHLLVQAFLAGSAGLLPLALWLAPGTTAALALVLAGSALAHLLLVVAETTLPHPTAQARLAGHDLLRGGSALFFWTGVALVAIAVTAPWTGPWTFAPTLAGLAAYEHAYVRAGQSVPLA